MSGLISKKLSNEKTPPGHCILADSAFAASARVTNGKIVRARKSNERCEGASSAELDAIDIVMQKVYSSERQSAEWGVRAVKAPFARLKVPIPADSYKRQRLMRVCVHLFNFRTQKIWLNQIKATYADNSDDAQPWVHDRCA